MHFVHKWPSNIIRTVDHWDMLIHYLNVPCDNWLHF